MYISYNKYQVYSKSILLAIVLSIIILFVCRAPLSKLSFQFSWKVAFLIFLCLFLFRMMVVISLQLLFLQKGVNINVDDKLLEITYFLKKKDIVRMTDIKEFTTTKLMTKSTTYEGIMVYSNTGKKYLFDDISISDYKPVNKFLEDCNISFAGHEKFNNLNYFISFFKYK